MECRGPLSYQVKLHDSRVVRRHQDNIRHRVWSNHEAIPEDEEF